MRHLTDIPEIIIHVKGGVVEVIKKPPGVVLRIVDFDKETYGGESSEEVWTEMDMAKEE